MNATIKNIIFDLNGVIFEYSTNSDFVLLDKQKAEPSSVIRPIQPIENGVKILKQLQSTKNSSGDARYQLFACTNWKSSVIDLLKNKHANIISLFNAVITPDLSKAKKPDHQMFKYLTEKYNLIPSQCLFLDDQLQNVQSAQDFDMAAIHVNNQETVWDKIQEVLIKNN